MCFVNIDKARFPLYNEWAVETLCNLGLARLRVPEGGEAALLDFSFSELYNFVVTLVSLFLAYRLKTKEGNPDRQQKKPPLSD